MFLYLFLFVILKFFLNPYHSIISLSVLRYVNFLSRHFSLNCSLYYFFFSYIISLCSMYLFVSLCFLFNVHYSIYFFHFSLYLSYSLNFRLALKRNNYTNSKMDTLIDFNFVPLITRDQQSWLWCACRTYPVFSVARSANSASSCYAIAICSEPKFTKNVKSYRCVCKKLKWTNVEMVENSYPALRAATRPFSISRVKWSWLKKRHKMLASKKFKVCYHPLPQLRVVPIIPWIATLFSFYW